MTRSSRASSSRSLEAIRFGTGAWRSKIEAALKGGARMRKNWHISRRTMLQGVGAALALPWLEAMGKTPLAAAESRTGKPPLRTVFVYHPLGAETTAWKGVKGQGKDLQLTPTLQPLEPIKEHLLVLD